MSEEYARELSKMAVSKAAVALGYKFAQPEAVDCLADVMRHYIEDIAKETQTSVESYGRTNPGIMDVFGVLQKPRPNVTTWRDLKHFAVEGPAGSASDTINSQSSKKAIWNQPFPCQIAPFPVKRKIPPVPDSAVFGSKQELKDDLPDYLPPFPPAHTYKRARRRVAKKAGATAGTVESTDMVPSQANSRSIQGALSVLEEKSSK